MIFFSFFKTLVDKEVIVELKNGMMLRGTLVSVDPYHNIKLKNLQVIDAHKYPQFSSVKRIFIRGSVFRYVVLAKKDVDTTLLQDACRRESLKASTAMNANTAGASQ